MMMIDQLWRQAVNNLVRWWAQAGKIKDNVISCCVGNKLATAMYQRLVKQKVMQYSAMVALGWKKMKYKAGKT